jgi:hypothetical protein
MSNALSLRLLAVGALGVTAFVVGRWTARPIPSPASALPPPESILATAGAVAPRAVQPESKTPAESTSARLAATAARAVGNLAAEEERQRAIEQWAELDPRAAMTFARTKLKGDRQAQATAAVLAIWGKKDPEAAWNWVGTEMPAATHHFDTLLETFGRQSTETAARFAARFAAEHPEAALEVHLAALLGITYRGDFAGARSLIESNPALDAATRGTLANFLAGQWARFAPQEASTWVMNLPAGLQRDQAMIGLGESWSEVDPAGAAAFAVGLPGGATRTLALRQAIAKWVMTEPDAARAWVLNTPWHQDFDNAVNSIATDPNLVNRDPSRALKWTEGIFDDSLRAQSAGVILFNWYAADPVGAVVYVKESPHFSPEQRAEMLARLQAKN